MMPVPSIAKVSSKYEIRYCIPKYLFFTSHRKLEEIKQSRKYIYDCCKPTKADTNP